MEDQGKYDVATQQKELGIGTASGSVFLDMDRFNFAKEVSKMLATSTMLPEQFRGGAGVSNCMILLNLAERMRVDPFMLAQTMYIVKGRPGIEAKLAIALFNDGTKRFEPPLQFDKEGEFPKGKDARCRAYAKDIKSGKNLYGEWIDHEMIKGMGWLDKKGPDGTSGSNMWRNMPGQMFVYRASMFFIREYEPGVLLGLRTKDELEDMIIDVTPAPLKIEGASPDDTNFKDDIYAAKEFAGKESEPDKAEQEEAPEKAEIVTKISKIQNPLAFKKWVIDNASDLVGWPKPRFLELQAKWIKLGLPPEDFPITLKEPEGTPVEGGEPGHPPDDTVICPMTGKPKPLHECEMEGGCPQVGDRGTFPDDACGVYKKAKGT